jgi:hypothetical protein
MMQIFIGQVGVNSGSNNIYFPYNQDKNIYIKPVRIRVRVGSPHPLVCRKRRLPSDETGKTEVPCHRKCGTIKIPPCSKALSAERRLKLCSPSPAMVMSPYNLSEIFLNGT